MSPITVSYLTFTFDDVELPGPRTRHSKRKLSAAAGAKYDRI